MTGALTKAAVGVALLALGGCQTAKEQVHMRLTSPDGAYEAVLMVCQTPSDFTSNDLVVAVFGEKGRDCDKPYVHAVTAARLTHTYGADDPKATIRWDGQTLVMDSLEARSLISGNKDDEVPIRLEGPVSALYDWNNRSLEAGG